MEYKTKLEELTLEELETIVSEAPEGWDTYSLESENYHGIYFKWSGVCHIKGYHDVGWNTVGLLCGSVLNRQIKKRDILTRIDLLTKVKENYEGFTLKGYCKSKGKTTSETIKLDVSEFVNSVYIEDGKVILDMDKEHLEGVIKLMEEKVDE